jgi:hypothetical protein
VRDLIIASLVFIATYAAIGQLARPAHPAVIRISYNI